MNANNANIGWIIGNLPDLVVLGVVVLSALFAFYRGFVRETLAICGWVGAAFATVWLLPLGREYTREWIDLPWLSDFIAGAAIFLSALVVFWFFIHFIVSRVKDSPLNSLDRSLGLLFGVARGVFVLALLYMVASQAAWREEDSTPSWVLQARSLPMIDYAAILIVALVPEGTFNLPVEGFRNVQDQAKELEETREQLEQFKRFTDPPVAQPEASEGETSYDEQQVKEMDRLIDTLPNKPEGGSQ
ncbi:uncharacterized protein METZ01_LOCUS377164 [marine metagenome]|uniref:Colicin V production protein n=1 Tax=marine metagenome TaxID=408172 RepID=A0A382TQJ4_9ZZZZ